MRIAAVLGVKDEVSLIAASIAHLRKIGVDHIAVSDVGSTDGTLDVVEAECRAGDVSLTHMDPAAVDYDTFSDHELAIARKTGADWVVFLDADEFLIPATGSIKACRHLDDADVIVIERFNVVPTPSRLMMPADLSPPHYASLLLLTRRVPHFRSFLHERPDVPFITVQPGTRVMARPRAIATIAPGSHDVRVAAPSVRRVACSDVLAAHVPFTTLSRFERKVANIRAEIEMHTGYFEGEYAWHWRRWAEMSDGALREEFARQLADDQVLLDWHREGIVSSAADLLGELESAAAVPPLSACAGPRACTTDS